MYTEERLYINGKVIIYFLNGKSVNWRALQY